MKKQLLLLVLAVFAGYSSLFGQTCADGPLSPAAGTPYNYAATVSGAGYDGTGPFTWYVTKDVDLINGAVVPNSGGEIIASGAGAYNAPIGGANTITIEWTSQAIANNVPYYLVIKYSQTNAGTTPSCSAMNMKVWAIQPINKFLLAVNSFAGAIGMDGVYCSADVSSAIVTPGASPTVAYVYGVNNLYAEITASKYAGEWTPSFKITGLDAIQTIASVNWDTDPAGTFANTTTLGAPGEYVSNSNAIAAYDGSLKIYVRVTVDNNSFENLAGETVNVAVDGIIPVTTGSPLPDVISDTDCAPEAIFGKNTNLTVNPRPTVTPDPATGNFIPKNP